jgi:dTMP kinase
MGRLVIVEGINGCGKTTVISILKEYFEHTHPELQVYDFKLPGDFVPGLRDLFKENSKNLQSTTNVFLIAAEMYEFINTTLKEVFFQENSLILLDRSVYSTYVYQGCLGDCPKEMLDYILSPIVFDSQLILLLDISLENYKKHREKQKSVDRFERVVDSDDENFRKITNGYINTIQNSGKRYAKIDSNRPITDVASDCYDEIVKIL